ncbi:MAG: hypothetical protein INR65_20070, partial [Gluconacetobacter diazotrophicus]|nr:hypothetical protein [Gluconacetobacter diazotrophicus]
INARAGSGRRTFADAFGVEADGASLDAVRDTFARKAFNSRQLALLQALLADGRDPAAILSLPVTELSALAHPAADRYRARRGVPGPYADADPAFVTEHGAPIPPEQLPPTCPPRAALP